MPLILLLIFIVVPLIELYVLIQVGQVIGVVPTLVILLAGAIVGSWLFKTQGSKTWKAFRLALVERRLPAVEVADGALVIVGGAFLITPGFVTDAIGLLCLLPPTRAALRRTLTGVIAKRLGVKRSSDGPPWRRGPRQP